MKCKGNWLPPLGAVPLALLLLLSRPVEMLAQGYWPIHTLYFLAMAGSLCMLGVVRPAHSALTYLIPAAVVACFYILAGSCGIELFYPASLGKLLLALTGIFGVTSAVRNRSLGRLALKDAVCLFALLLLAGLGSYVRKTPHSYGATASQLRFAFTLLLYFGWLFGVLLLPFLRRNRFGGVTLLSIGTAGLLSYFLTAPPSTFFTRVDAPVAKYLFDSFYAYTPVFTGFILGGLYCMLPWRKVDPAKPE